MTRLKLAELTSAIGALVLGVGLGAMFSQWLSSASAWIVFAGTAAHAFGMWDKHHLEAPAPTESAGWIVALYWVCWLLLGAAVAVVFING